MPSKMMLASLLSENQIAPELQAEERWGAIEELVDLLVGCGRLNASNRADVLHSIRQREETMSTGIGLGIAIPHASSDLVTEVVAAFGRSTKGVEFDSVDSQPVSFIVLFLVPKDQFQTHLRTLAAIAKFLNDRTVREELTGATSAEAILEVFRNRGGTS